jgi:hypothetical protein
MSKGKDKNSRRSFDSLRLFRMTNFYFGLRFLFRLKVRTHVRLRVGILFSFIVLSKSRGSHGLPLLRCWVRCLCGGRLAFAEAWLAAALGFEDLLGFASAAGVYAGES